MNTLVKNDSWSGALKKAAGKISSTSLALATTASTLGAYWAYQQWMNSIYSLPPSGGTLPFVGNLHSIGEHSLHLDYLKIQRENHLPDMYLLKVGPRNSVIVINKFEIMKDALETQGDLFAARPPMTVTEIMKFEDEIFNKSVPDATWRDAKKWFFISSAGGQGTMKGSEHQINVEVAKMIDFIDDNKIHDVPVDICDLIQRVEANVVFTLMMNKNYPMDDPVLIHRINLIVTWYKEFAFDFFRMELCTPFFARILHKERAQDLVQKTNNVRAFCREEIKQHLATVDPSNPRDYLDLYLTQKEDVDIDTLVNTTFVLMPDAIDTMSKMMNWVVAYTVFYPEVQKRMQAEIDKACGGEERPIVFSDHPNLQYTQAVIMEATRVTCPLIITGLHTSVEDCTFRGYHLPKGQPMICNLYGALTDPEIYKNPSQFDPDRFLDESGNLDKGIKTEAWVPFGLGRRKCMGTNLTRKEILVVIANLFRCYDVTFPKGAVPSMVPEHNVIFRTVEPFKVLLNRRKPNFAEN